MTREEAIKNIQFVRNYLDDTSKMAISFDMAIKALEQEPKVEHWIENLCDSCTNKACEFQSGILRSKCDFYIAPMPHLEPDNCGNYIVQQEPKTGHWTPISEGLPEEKKTVIASSEYGVYPEARYTKEDGWEWAYESGADYWEKLECVTAWMPLPKPYKAGGEKL